jgi:hypothetical protein
MSFLLVAELFAAYTFGGAFLCLLGFASWDWLRDMDAQRRMDTLIAVEAARFAEDAEVALLDSWFALPARRHP